MSTPLSADIIQLHAKKPGPLALPALLYAGFVVSFHRVRGERVVSIDALDVPFRLVK